MSADFWAGYLSGAVGIVVGNPLDIIKLRQQTRSTAPIQLGPQSSTTVLKGTAAPIIGYGALNALLFVSYHRSETTFNQVLSTHHSLWATWFGGAVGGLATWVVSTPTELIKCRAQFSSPARSSWSIAHQIWRSDGMRGLYFGGMVTALRDSIGYGFYFWSYELASRLWLADSPEKHNISFLQETPKILLCGGLAGIVTWASVFPLDVIKTRVQTQPLGLQTESTALIQPDVLQGSRRSGAWLVAKRAYREDGFRVFFRGLTVCSIRAFVVNAAQWAVYEWIMNELGQGYGKRINSLDVDGVGTP